MRVCVFAYMYYYVVIKSDIPLNIVNHQRYVEHCCNCYIVRDMLLYFVITLTLQGSRAETRDIHCNEQRYIDTYIVA